jgi:uncharacterized protein YjbJ (UPF0337 family)
MRTMLDPHIMGGRWKQVRGRVVHWWGQVTKNDMRRLHGRFEILAGMVEERYGHTRGHARIEAGRFMRLFRPG